MAIPEHFRPFARSSPFLDLIGPIYESRSDGRLTLGLEIRAQHCNRRGTAHGGLLTTLADIVLGYTSGHSGISGRQLTTASLTVDFLGFAKVGDWVEGRAEILKMGKSLAYASCLLTTGEARIVHASGVFRVS